jgi:endonuclease/exonuclease/phosphatase family metal-dependent hydrolase
MPSPFRRFTKRIFILTNWVVTLLFLLAVAAPYLPSGQFWVLGTLTLLFPIWLFSLLFFTVFWLLVKPRWSLLPIITLLIGWKTITETIGLRWGTNAKHSSDAIKIMSWNVHMFDFYDYKKEPWVREKMWALINEQQPAIACFQEFAYTMPYKDKQYTLDVFKSKMPFSYSFIQSHPLDSTELKKVGLHFGKAIFSQYPIINAHHVFNKKGNYNYSFLYADVALPSGTVRVFNIHLQSLYFNNLNYEFVEKLGDNNETIEDGSKNVLRKIRNGFYKRGEQADTIRKYIEQSPYPVIVCGDFNDVPGSYAYRTVKGNLQDAFVEKGVGISRTFTRLSPTLRIDNIFADKSFEVEDYQCIPKTLSDHFPVIATIKAKPVK